MSHLSSTVNSTVQTKQKSLHNKLHLHWNHTVITDTNTNPTTIVWAVHRLKYWNYPSGIRLRHCSSNGVAPTLRLEKASRSSVPRVESTNL